RPPADCTSPELRHARHFPALRQVAGLAQRLLHLRQVADGDCPVRPYPGGRGQQAPLEQPTDLPRSAPEPSSHVALGQYGWLCHVPAPPPFPVGRFTHYPILPAPAGALTFVRSRTRPGAPPRPSGALFSVSPADGAWGHAVVFRSNVPA